jgi:hypothetical protein
MAINLDHVTEQITVTDTATNASLTVQPKGTGAFNIAAGSSGLNLSNGNTVTAITSTDPGSAYTSVPTVNITAPTTAGGVQAVITTNVAINAGTIGSGGTGYTVGNVLTLVGGTTTGGASTWTVAAVSGGVVTSVTSTSPARYTAFPSLPASVTGGSGSGFTFSALSGFVNQFVISNAGSGYVEQPTISFTGGGGSAAAAYASVGGASIVRSIGNNLNFSTPSGIALSLYDASATTVNYFQMQGRAAGAPPLMSAGGSDTNINFLQSSKGTGQLSLYTNTFSQEQVRVTHTASAVNYLQVTGAATGGRPNITAQGSDTNIGFLFDAKGTTSNTVFRGSSGSQIQFVITNSGAGTNYLQTASASTGVAPSISVIGGDTNIDLNLTPKGTGGVINNVNGNSLTVTRNSGLNIMKVTAANIQNLALQATGGGSVYLKTGDDTSTQFVAAFTASAVNFLQAAGSVTGSGVTLSAQGSDTNIDLTLTPKGTGNVGFGTYTASILTPTGYVEIKDSGGTVRRLLVG